MSTTNYPPAAVSYARALLELANEQNQAVPVSQELGDLRQIVDESPTFTAFLGDPAIGTAERAGVLGSVFRGRMSPLIYNFLGVMNNHGRLGLLPKIMGAYDALLDEQLGNVEVTVTVARALGEDQLAQVQQRVSQSLGKNAVVHQTVDESILGGMVLRVEDKLIDASVRAQLAAMRERLLAARARS